MTQNNYHTIRRDELMHAARVLKKSKKPTPGTVQVMQDCVRKAREHNHMALLVRRTPTNHS